LMQSGVIRVDIDDSLPRARRSVLGRGAASRSGAGRYSAGPLGRQRRQFL